jgi:hypothetical protein
MERFAVGPASLLWRDGSRREHRRACLRLVRDQRVEVNLPLLSPSVETPPTTADVILARAQRAHCRLSWETRLTRNARRDTAGQVTIKLFGVPNDFARDLGLTCESVRMPGASQGNPPESRADQG